MLRWVLHLLFFFFTLHNNIYIYCIYSLNCLWQQIKPDIHVKLILIKLYKNFFFAKQNTATPQMFVIPEDGWKYGESSPARCSTRFYSAKGGKARSSLKQTVTA